MPCPQAQGATASEVPPSHQLGAGEASADGSPTQASCSPCTGHPPSVAHHLQCTESHRHGARLSGSRTATPPAPGSGFPHGRHAPQGGAGKGPVRESMHLSRCSQGGLREPRQGGGLRQPQPHHPSKTAGAPPASPWTHPAFKADEPGVPAATCGGDRLGCPTSSRSPPSALCAEAQAHTCLAFRRSRSLAASWVGKARRLKVIATRPSPGLGPWRGRSLALPPQAPCKLRTCPTSRCQQVPGLCAQLPEAEDVRCQQGTCLTGSWLLGGFPWGWRSFC